MRIEMINIGRVLKQAHEMEKLFGSRKKALTSAESVCLEKIGSAMIEYRATVLAVRKILQKKCKNPEASEKKIMDLAVEMQDWLEAKIK